MNVKRTGIVLRPDARRVLLRPFRPSTEERTTRLVARTMALPEEIVERELAGVLSAFEGRHRGLDDFLLKRFEQVCSNLLVDQSVSRARQMLIGAYFTHEYSVESAALFNPSIVWHPDQSGLPEGRRRFVLTLRATGEGHISSIAFRSGTIGADGHITVDSPAPFTTAAAPVPGPRYHKPLFERMLLESGLSEDFVDPIMAGLDESFTLNDLESRLQGMLGRRPDNQERLPAVQSILSLARSNYELIFRSEDPLSERVIFPSTPAESHGIEDARFVAFQDEDSVVTYYATYTAYDGSLIRPQLLETPDFCHFKISRLNGPAVRNKGLALFPRKINGLYAMISRQDNENFFVMFSPEKYFWDAETLVARPVFPWEFVQIGNCGSPIETEAGWLVLSHGVGPMRRYTIGAFLLDLEDPSRVIGRLKEPLLVPDEEERDGYVPNVVYSCGGLIHGRELIIPYAVSDYASTFATLNLDQLLNELTS